MKQFREPAVWSIVFIAAAVWNTCGPIVNPLAVLLMGIAGIGLAAWADHGDTRGES